MLKPSMQDLMKKVNNRYLLVNLAAQRARDISVTEDNTDAQLDDKPVKIALDEICSEKIEYRKGPKPQPEPEIDLLAAMNTEAADSDDIVAEDEAEEADAEGLEEL